MTTMEAEEWAQNALLALNSNAGGLSSILEELRYVGIERLASENRKERWKLV